MRFPFQLLTLLALLFCQFSCAQTANAQALPPASFEEKLQSTPSAIVLDVRTPEEYRTGHIDGALNLNYHDADFRAQIARLDKTKPVFVYCAAGGRSGSSATMLQELGFPAVYDLKGGMKAWKSAGKTTVQ